MFILNGIYKSVKPDKSLLPIAEGTVLTDKGALAAEDGSDAYGIVPQNVYHIAATGLISVAVSGTIDMTDKANAGVEFTAEMMDALHEFNFVPKVGIGLPSPAAADVGKVLTAVEAMETITIVPEQSFTFTPGQSATFVSSIIGVDFSKLSDGQSVTLVGTTAVETSEFPATYVEDSTGKHITCIIPDAFVTFDITEETVTLSGLGASGLASSLVSASATATVSAGAKASWEEASGGGGVTACIHDEKTGSYSGQSGGVTSNCAAKIRELYASGTPIAQLCANLRAVHQIFGNASIHEGVSAGKPAIQCDFWGMITLPVNGTLTPILASWTMKIAFATESGGSLYMPAPTYQSTEGVAIIASTITFPLSAPRFYLDFYFSE